MNRFRFTSFFVMATVAVHGLSGCSFSKSSESSSASSGSASDLASSPFSLVSSSSLNDREKYERDVRDYTAEFVQSSGGDIDNFRVRVGKLAEKYSITNWEGDKSTYLAIGKGLRKSGVSESQYESFKTRLVGESAQRTRYIEEGYRQR